MKGERERRGGGKGKRERGERRKEGCRLWDLGFRFYFGCRV